MGTRRRRGRRESGSGVWECRIRWSPNRGCNDNRAPFTLVNGRSEGLATGGGAEGGGSGASSPRDTLSKYGSLGAVVYSAEDCSDRLGLP